MQTHHLLLGDGIDAAQERRRDHSGDHEFPPARRTHRTAGRGTMPGARTFQRAGRSHDGHLGTDERQVHGEDSGGSFNSRRRASTAPTRSKRSSTCTRATSASSSGWAATSSPPRPTPNSPRKALQKCRLTAHVSTKLNRSHLITGEIALILPCLGRSEIDRQEIGEQFVTVEDSMGIINPSRGSCAAGERISAERAGHRRPAWRKPRWARRSTVDWKDLVANYDRIRDHIEHVIPGFEDFNDRIRARRFLSAERRAGQTAVQHADRQSELHRFRINAGHKLGPGQYLMTTVRSHDQFNTTIYGLNDRYRGVYNGRRVVFMNAEDVQSGWAAAGATRRSDEPFRRRGARRAAFHGCALSDRARLHGDLFSGSQCARPDQQHGGSKQHPHQQEPGDFDQTLSRCGCRRG